MYLDVRLDSNNLPVISSDPETEINVSEPFTYEIIAEDSDGDSLTYSLVTMPDGMTLSNNIISWVPQQLNIGMNEVSFKVEDEFGGEDYQSFGLEVVEAVNETQSTTRRSSSSNIKNSESINQSFKNQKNLDDLKVSGIRNLSINK